MTNNDNIILGQYHKEFTKKDLIVSLIGFTIMIIISIVLSLCFEFIGIYIFSGIMMIFSFIVILALIHEYKKVENMSDEIITYDKDNNKFIIKSYNKIRNINISEIETINYKNRFLKVCDPIFYFETTEEGNIIFKLKGKKRIKTLKIKEVVRTYDFINDIINGIDVTELV